MYNVLVVNNKALIKFVFVLNVVLGWEATYRESIISVNFCSIFLIVI